MLLGVKGLRHAWYHFDIHDFHFLFMGTLHGIDYDIVPKKNRDHCKGMTNLLGLLFYFSVKMVSSECYTKKFSYDVLMFYLYCTNMLGISVTYLVLSPIVETRPLLFSGLVHYVKKA